MLEAFIDAVERLGGVSIRRRKCSAEQADRIDMTSIIEKATDFSNSAGRWPPAARLTAAFDVEARAPLERLRAKLESNLASLQTHLTAVGEIAAVIARAIQDHEFGWNLYGETSGPRR